MKTLYVVSWSLNGKAGSFASFDWNVADVKARRLFEKNALVFWDEHDATENEFDRLKNLGE